MSKFSKKKEPTSKQDKPYLINAVPNDGNWEAEHKFVKVRITPRQATEALSNLKDKEACTTLVTIEGKEYVVTTERLRAAQEKGIVTPEELPKEKPYTRDKEDPSLKAVKREVAKMESPAADRRQTLNGLYSEADLDAIVKIDRDNPYTRKVEHGQVVANRHQTRKLDIKNPYTKTPQA